MMRRSRARTAVAVGLVTGLAVIAALAAAWLCGDARALAAHPDPASLLLAVAELATAALLGRCGLGAALGLAAVALGRTTTTARAALRVTPGLLRPALSALLAFSVSTAAVAPALAAVRSPTLPAASWFASDGGEPVPHDRSALTEASLPSAGWVPAAETSPRAPTSGRLLTGTTPREPATPDVVVHRGDTLWTIVARALGPRASDARIAAEWPRWYASNRTAIGSDPDLLQPGTILHAPQAASR